jgi:hypothetical protein
MSLSLAYIILEKTKDFFIFMKAISESPCHFLTAQKVTQKAPEDLGFRTFLLFFQGFNGSPPSVAFRLAIKLRLPKPTAIFNPRKEASPSSSLTSGRQTLDW